MSEDKKPALKKLSQFQTPDGMVFNTQREASEHLRKHLVVEALGKLPGVGTDTITVEWLQTNKEAVLKAYDAAKVERPAPSPETMEKLRVVREKMTAAYREKYGSPEK